MFLSRILPYPRIALTAVAILLASCAGAPSGNGLWVVYFWQVLVVAFAVPKVLLPPPLAIIESMGLHGAILWRDFVQTVLKAVLIGWTGFLGKLAFR